MKGAKGVKEVKEVASDCAIPVSKRFRRDRARMSIAGLVPFSAPTRS